jgi:hypothetical protein
MRIVMRAVLVLLVFVGCGKSKAEGMPAAPDWTGGSNEVLDPGGFNGQVAKPEAPDDDVHNRLQQGDSDESAAPQEEPDPHVKTGPADPNAHVKGTIKLAEKAKAHIKDGGTVFLSVKKLGPDGKPVGSALAVDKVDWRDGATFNVTGIGGDTSGDLVVIAHYDQDGNASSTEPGDVLGQTKIKVPADNVQIVLDTVVPKP